ncbi:MAG: electron transfer flavoprotein subunit alpha [Clostridia bacterium]|jgi:electron transfer flavoprotein alpha subunit|nr:electron transfer flavoprotein subunit alpha [Clostridia bacterium]
MATLRFDAQKCNLCGLCLEKCPFNALEMGEKGIIENEKCRMCGVCIKVCAQKALSFEQKASKAEVDKNKWKGILIYAEQEESEIHPVVYELIGEARRLGEKVGYDVYAVIVGGKGTNENAKKLIPYGVKKVFSYEHTGFDGFKTDCYTDAISDCIASLRPSVVLIGATALGRSLAPRLSVRFHTGLTADCTKLDIKLNTDLVQVRPAFGGNIMAQILISRSRPQFSTVRYKIMDKAKKVENPDGEVVIVPVTDDMAHSAVKVLNIEHINRTKSIEEEEVLVVAGRGAKNDVEMVRELATELGGQLAFTRPMAESGFGDNAHQIGLSGRTVKPKLIITCGVSGAIQFTAGMNTAECIIAINTDPEALIFNIANYCIVDDLYKVVPNLIKKIKDAKNMED